LVPVPSGARPIKLVVADANGKKTAFQAGGPVFSCLLLRRGTPLPKTVSNLFNWIHGCHYGGCAAVGSG